MGMNFFSQPMSQSLPTLSSRFNTRSAMLPPSSSPTPTNVNQPNGLTKINQGTQQQFNGSGQGGTGPQPVMSPTNPNSPNFNPISQTFGPGGNMTGQLPGAYPGGNVSGQIPGVPVSTSGAASSGAAGLLRSPPQITMTGGQPPASLLGGGLGSNMPVAGPGGNMTGQLPGATSGLSAQQLSNPAIYKGMVQQYGTPPAGVDPGTWFTQQAQALNNMRVTTNPISAPLGAQNIQGNVPAMMLPGSVAGPVQPGSLMAPMTR